jgi:hypothetical protein
MVSPRHSRRVRSGCMNPDSDRAVEMRRRALADQVDGLEKLISAGRNESHIIERLADTRSELATLEGVTAGA